MKPILVKGRPVASGRSAVCIPLVGRTREALRAEAAAAASLAPDVVEWRVDFFDGIARQDEVIATATELRGVLGGLPLLFTRRSVREGGEPVGIDDAAVAALCRAVCSAGAADLLDVEMSSAPAELEATRTAARQAGVTLVLSFHDFRATPPLDALKERFLLAERLGADVAKIAVMPRDMADVLTLLDATLQASQALSIPLVSMSMGPLGAVSRLCGGAFGSALSFGVGMASSAPGQLPAAGLMAALTLLQSAGAPPAGR